MRSDATPENDVSDVLLHAERWIVTCADSPAEDEARPPPRRRAWSREHAHINAGLEILLAVRGEDWFGMGGAMHRCRPGRLFLIDPGVPHDAYYPETASGLEHIWLWVLSDRVFVTWLAIEGGRCARLHEPVAVLHQNRLGVSTAPFADGARGPGSRIGTARLRLLVGWIATHLAEHLADAPDSAAGRLPKSGSIQANVAAAVRRQIDDTDGRGATLETLSHFAGYSPYHLSRMFRAWSGCSIHQYVDQARRRKMEAMRAAGATNGAIAESLGFSEASAFLRWRRTKRAALRDREGI